MKCRILIIVFGMLCLAGCDQLRKESSKEKTSKKKEGIVKQYYPDGTLKLAISYEKGKRNGLAKSYYKDGVLRQEITYVNNVKHGMATTYYENGRKYQETPYVNGKKEGIRKKYRMNGKLMAEVPFTDNEPCAGLVEYLLNGNKKTEFPEIRIRPVDELLKKNRYSLILSISDGSKDVAFYSGKLEDNGCIPHYAIELGSDRPGQVKVVYDLPRNAFIMEEMNFMAKIETTLGNPYIIETSHYLAIENK